MSTAIDESPAPALGSPITERACAREWRNRGRCGRPASNLWRGSCAYRHIKGKWICDECSADYVCDGADCLECYRGDGHRCRVTFLPNPHRAS